MTNNSFFAQIRQYASHARRTGKSFAEAVTAVHDLRWNSLSDEITDADALQRAREKLKDVLDREYAPFDTSFQQVFTEKSISTIPF